MAGSKWPRPKTPRVEIHAAQIPEWRKAAEAAGQPLAEWIRDACDEKLKRKKR